MHRWRNPVVGVAVAVFWLAFHGIYALLTPCGLAFADGATRSLLMFDGCRMELQFLGIGLGVVVALLGVVVGRGFQAIVGG